MKKTIEVCDKCNRHEAEMGLFCVVCNAHVCFSCVNTIKFNVHNVDICHVCARRADVLQIAQKYNKKYWKLVDAQEKDLTKLSKRKQ